MFINTRNDYYLLIVPSQRGNLFGCPLHAGKARTDSSAIKENRLAVLVTIKNVRSSDEKDVRLIANADKLAH